MKHPLLRLKYSVNATRAYVNPHGIWLPVPPGMVGGSKLECVKLLRQGSVALHVGEYMAECRVYLVEGAPVILDYRELEQAK